HGPPHRVRRPGARDGHRSDDPTSAARLAGRYPPLSGTASGVHHGGMREILFDRFGGPDVLTLHTDSPRPEPAEGEVLVEVSYAGLNPLDFKIRDGSSGMAEGLPLPAGTGREMTGVVLGAGADLDLAELGSRGLAPGTRVFGMRRPEDRRGVAAEVIAIAADDLAPVPDEVSAQDLPRWAGLALAGLTAIATVQDAAELREGRSVLIHGGSGGVGQLLIPMALEAGASRVRATGRGANAARIRQLLAGLTAIATVQDAAELREGRSVLIHGGSGGVGQLLIPMALEAGASRVWATGRAANAERIRELGAEPIPYDEVDWREALREATG